MIYFISITGYQTAIKGIVANFLGHYRLSIEIEGKDYFLTRELFGYKTQMKKLPSGLVHCIIFPELAMPKTEDENKDTFFVITDRKEDLLSLFFCHLDYKTEIPLDPSWDKWLAMAFRGQEGWITRGRTLIGSYMAFLFKFNPVQLENIISEAISKKAPEVASCFEWKGGEDDGQRDCA